MEIDEIVRLVSEIDRDRIAFTTAADIWEDAYALRAFDDTAAEKLAREGIEQVTLPTPQAVTGLARRLIADNPKIVIPPRGEPTDKEDERLRLIEEWLTALYPANNTQYQTNVISDLGWQSVVLGRHALEIKWVREKLPKHRQKSSLPIMMRCLDPRNVGVLRGPLFPMAAYHKYTVNIKELVQTYPEYGGDRRKNKAKSFYDRYLADQDSIQTEVEITDFWWVEDDGKVWNAVLLDDWDFAVEPWETKYCEIPIIEGYADSSPSSDEVLKSLSLLAPIVDLWKFQCRMVSMSGTGLQYLFMPLLLAVNDGTGGDMPDLTTGLIPNTINYIPSGYTIQQITPQANLNLLQSVFNQVDAASQQSSFPGVMYGQAPGDIQAGFGVNLLRDQAQGRIKGIRNNLENTLATAHRIVLGLVEELAGKDGVTLWGYHEGDRKTYTLTLTKKDIDGTYENRVVLAPAVTDDNVQKQTLGIQMANARAISWSTFRDHFLSVDLPRDEDVRIALEDAIMAKVPGMMEKRSLRAIQTYYELDQEGLERAIVGTGLWDVYMAEKQWDEQKRMDKEAQQLYDETGQVPMGYHPMPDGTVMRDDQMPAQGGPGQQPMPGGPMPPGAPAGAPPPPGQGMPPEMMGPPPEMGGMPLQPEGMVPGDLPPQMQGQISLQDLGLSTDDPEVQVIYSQLMEQGLTDAQIQNVLLEKFRKRD